MTTQVRVLHIVAGLDIGQAFGGAERSGLELSRELNRDSALKVSLCSFWRCGGEAESQWISKLRSEGISFFFASSSAPRRNLSAFFAGIRRINQSLRNTPADIVHAHHEGGALAACLAKWNRRARAALRTAYVPTDREWGAGIGARVMRLICTDWLFPLTLNAEVGVAPAFVESLNLRPVAQLFKRQTHLIYNTSSLADYQQTESVAKDPFHFADDDLIVGSLGRLTEQKGYLYLIEAAPCVLACVPNVKFLLIGDGEERETLQQRAEQLGVNQHIVFAGRRDDGNALLQRMNLFVLPSLWEGVPLALLEAISSGVPVVTTDIPGNRELIQSSQTGWAVPPRDAQALARAIIEALQHTEEAAARAQRARDVLPQFSLSQIAEQYKMLYQRLSG